MNTAADLTATGIPLPEERPWLTVAELAAITGEGQKTIRRALEEGQLPLLRVGRFMRIPTAELRRVLGLDVSPPAGTDGAPPVALAQVRPLARPVEVTADAHTDTAAG